MIDFFHDRLTKRHVCLLAQMRQAYRELHAKREAMKALAA